MLTLSIKDSPNLPTGWQTVKITNAVDTEHKGTRCIDLFFDGLPDSLNCRLWSKIDEDTGEDFGICNVFRFTNAGVTNNGEGKLSIDDDVRHLHGKEVQVLFYTNKNGYTDAASRVVPVNSTEFDDSFVDGLKAKAESWIRNKVNGLHVNGTTTETSHANEGVEVPF